MGDISNKATAQELLIISLLTEQYKTPKQIIYSLKISHSRIYQIINSAKKKGLLKGSQGLGWTKPTLSPIPPLDNPLDNPPTFPMEIRLHGQEFQITLARQTRHKKRVLFRQGARVHIYKQSIVLWGSDQLMFYGNTPDDCLKQSMAFWQNIFYWIEERINQYFFSKNTGVIKQVAAHYEEVNSNFAKVQGNDRIVIRSTADQKVWLETDKSLKPDNTECKHPDTAHQDAQKVFDDVFNSWRDGKALTPMEATKAIGDLAMNMHYYAENMRSHVKAIKLLAKNIGQMNKSKLKDTKQKELSRWL